MKLLTWNINGVRATKSPLKVVLDELAADIICLQETKVTKDQLDSSIAIIDGYNSYFAFSQVRQGYSGVATFCKDSFIPTKAQEGLFSTFQDNNADNRIGDYGDLESMFSSDRALQLDKEGRTLITEHEFCNHEDVVEKLTIFNVYCPRADPDRQDRIEFKMDYYKALEERAKSVLKSGSHVIICGDINTSHRPVDHCDPDDPEIFYDSPFREWLDRLLLDKGDYSSLKSSMEQETLCESQSTKRSTPDISIDSAAAGNVSFSVQRTSTSSINNHFVDTFRYFFPNRQDAFTCWSTLKGCRQTNYGTRIDYILASKDFHLNFVKFCNIHPEVEGSDHCPVKVELRIDIRSATKCPPCCTKYMPVFRGRQKKLSNFFSIKQSTLNENTINKSLSHKRKLGGDSVIRKQAKISFFVEPKNRISSTVGINNGASEYDVDCFKKQKSLKIPPTVSKPAANSGASAFWKSVLKGPEPPPLCHGHNEPSVLRTVKKEGPNVGKQFYVCCRPDGHKNNPEARCKFFQWKKTK